MTLLSGIALFVAMLISALIPGPSVMAVVSRSISDGARHGLRLTFGILLADYIFICLALTGLSTISSILGEFGVVFKYFGASYLLWLAYCTWRAEITLNEEVACQTNSLRSTILVGLVIGLANPKAILFYMGFFPAFVELSSIGPHEVMIILLISTFAVGGVLSIYALVGAKVRHVFKGEKARTLMNRLSGTVLASCAVLLAIRV